MILAAAWCALLILSGTRPRLSAISNRDTFLIVIAVGLVAAIWRSRPRMVAVSAPLPASVTPRAAPSPFVTSTMRPEVPPEHPPLSTGLDRPWIFWAALSGLTIVQAADPRAAFETWIFQAACMALIMATAAVFLRGGLSPRQAIRALLLAGALPLIQMIVALTAYGTESLAALRAGIEPYPFRLWGVLDNPAIFGMVLAMLLPLAVGYAFDEGLSRRERLAVLLWAGLALIGVVAHGTRSATIATAIGLIGVGALIATRGRRWVWRLRARTVAATIVGFVALFAAIVWVQGRAPNHAELTARSEVYSAALAGFAARPLTGWGPGAFVMTQARAFSAPPAILVPHAHNLILSVAAEGGAAGLIATTALIASAVGVCVRAWKAAPEQRGVLIAVDAALIGFLAAGLFDQPLSQPALVAVAMILLGLNTALVPVPESGLELRALLIVLALVGWLYAGVALNGQYRAFLAIFDRYGALPASASTDERALVIGALEDLQARNPTDRLLTLQVGYWAADLGLGDRASLPKAIAAMHSAAGADPALSIHWVNLAALYTRAGDYRAARDAAQTAVDRAPDSPQAWLMLGLSQEALGDDSRARVSYAAALQHEPRWLYAPFWAADGGTHGARRAAYQAAAAALRAAPLTFETALLTGDADAAARLARDSTEALVANGFVRLSAGEPDRARATFAQAARVTGNEPVQFFAALGDDRASGDPTYPRTRALLAGSGPWGPGTGADLTYAQYTFWRAGLISSDVAPEATLDHQIDPATLGKPPP